MLCQNNIVLPRAGGQKTKIVSPSNRDDNAEQEAIEMTMPSKKCHEMVILCSSGGIKWLTITATSKILDQHPRLLARAKTYLRLQKILWF